MYREQDGTESEQVAFTRFSPKRNSFLLSQTAGADYTPDDLDLGPHAVLQALGIELIAFDHTHGAALNEGRSEADAIAVIPAD